MTNISNITTSSLYIKDSISADESFNDKVLHYLKQNKPEDKLNELIVQIRALSPDKGVSITKINEALLYADTYMRNTDEYKDYANNVLDKRTIQILGVNMFFNNMINKFFTESDDDIFI